MQEQELIPLPERNPETKPNFAILTPFEFAADFSKEAAYALRQGSMIKEDKRPKVWLQSMQVESGHGPEILYWNLQKAGELGFDARLHLDAYSRYVSLGSPNYIPVFGKDRPAFREVNKKQLEHLRQSGVNVIYTNPHKSLEKIMYMKGRSHKKMAVVSSEDRQVAWIGGMNMWDTGFFKMDYMVKITDPGIVAAIIDEFPRINENRRTEDAAIQCTPDTALLIDCGKRGESIILDKTMQQVEGAKQKIICISELEPEGEFLQVLTQAYKRHVEITFITNSPSKEGFELKANRIVKKLTFRYKNPEFPLTYPKVDLHAKLLIVDDQIIIVGSNNFSPTTAKYGTEEAALISTNPTLVGNAEAFVSKILQN